MSVARWYGTDCDFCGLAGEVMPTPSASWKAVERAGWTREYLRADARRTDGPIPAGSRGWVHRCPKCSAAASPEETQP